MRNWQGGGRASARETIGRVAAGAIARALLERACGIEVLAWVSRVREVEAKVDQATVSLDQVESNLVRLPRPGRRGADDPADRRGAGGRRLARRCGSSAWRAAFPPASASPSSTSLEADLAGGLMSLPASKGFEIGSGFAGTRQTGSQHNDPFVPGEDGRPRAASNRSGGVQGGISNGEPIVVRVGFKPTATIRSAQDTVDSDGKAVTLEAQGRHDPCVLPRAVPMVEAMVCLVLADHWLRQRAVDVL